MLYMYIIYSFIHYLTMIANNEKNKQIEIINIYATLTTGLQKKLLHNLYFRDFMDHSVDIWKICLFDCKGSPRSLLSLYRTPTVPQIW